MKVRLGDHLDFSNGRSVPGRASAGRFRVYGANGAIGYAAQHNATGPLIVLGRVGAYCGSLRYCDSDVWVTDNALVCRAKDPRETRYWYYALHTCGLGDHRAGSGQPLLNQGILRDVSVCIVAAPQRRRIAELLGALDDKIAANERAIAAAESLTVAIAESVREYAPLCALAARSAEVLSPHEFDGVVAHFSLPAFDDGARPRLVATASWSKSLRSSSLTRANAPKGLRSSTAPSSPTTPSCSPASPGRCTNDRRRRLPARSPRVAAIHEPAHPAPGIRRHAGHAGDTRGRRPAR